MSTVSAILYHVDERADLFASVLISKDGRDVCFLNLVPCVDDGTIGRFHQSCKKPWRCNEAMARLPYYSERLNNGQLPRTNRGSSGESMKYDKS